MYSPTSLEIEVSNSKYENFYHCGFSAGDKDLCGSEWEDLKKDWEAAAASVSCGKMLSQKVSSLLEALFAVCVKCFNFCSNPDEVTANVQRIKDDIREPLSTVSTEEQQTCHHMVEAIKRKMHKEFGNEWMKIEGCLQIE